LRSDGLTQGSAFRRQNLKAQILLLQRSVHVFVLLCFSLQFQARDREAFHKMDIENRSPIKDVSSPSLLLLGSPMIVQVPIDYVPQPLRPLGTPNHEFAADAKMAAKERRDAASALTLARLRSVSARAQAVSQVGTSLATAWQETLQQASAVAQGATQWKAENERLRAAVSHMVDQLETMRHACAQSEMEAAQYSEIACIAEAAASAERDFAAGFTQAALQAVRCFLSYLVSALF
jgi:hypothetical protein